MMIKSGCNENPLHPLDLANLPLVDTMHHALTAWCIFAAFVLTHRAMGTSGTKCGVLPRSLLSTVPFSVSRRRPFSRFYPGCILKIRKINVQKRTNYAAFILSAPIVYAILCAKLKPHYCLLPQHLVFSCIPQQILLRSAARKINLCQEISIVYCEYFRRNIDLLLCCAPNHLRHPSAAIVLEDDNFLITLPVIR